MSLLPNLAVSSVPLSFSLLKAVEPARQVGRYERVDRSKLAECGDRI
jgi:hypothetical protein